MYANHKEEAIHHNDLAVEKHATGHAKNFGDAPVQKFGLQTDKPTQFFCWNGLDKHAQAQVHTAYAPAPGSSHLLIAPVTIWDMGALHTVWCFFRFPPCLISRQRMRHHCAEKALSLVRSCECRTRSSLGTGDSMCRQCMVCLFSCGSSLVYAGSSARCVRVVPGWLHDPGSCSCCVLGDSAFSQ